MSLRLRLALFGAAVVALTLLLFGGLLYGLFSRGVQTNQDDLLRTRAAQAVLALEGVSDLSPQTPLVPADLKTSTEVFVEVLAPDGSLIYTTAQVNGLAPQAPSDLLSAASAHGGSFATVGDAARGTQLRLYAKPFPSGYVLTGQSTRVPQSSLSGIVGFLVISAVPTLLAALAASWLVAGRALRPLKEAAHAADDIGQTRDFSRRLAGRQSRDEVALLTASFNRMLDELQDAFRKQSTALESQRRFVADASHELRTPLTTIRGNAGLLSQGPPIPEDVRAAAANDIAEESERMARLVDRLLTLARADAGLELELTPLDLRPLVVEVARQAGTVHKDRNVEVDAAESIIAGNHDALRQLLWILADNAVRHARSTVAIQLKTDAGWARLTVVDDGPGIPEAERERIFERFYRADASRTGPGAGLGLAIARWIVEQHGGRILASDAPTGGAGLIVDLPLLRAS